MDKTQAYRSRKRRRMALVVVVDVLLTAACLVVFALFDHVLPQAQRAVTSGEPIATYNSGAMEGSPGGDFSEKFADKFTSGEVIATENSYQSASLNVTLSRHEATIDDRPVVYFVEDIYIRSIDCLRCLLAQDTYGQGITEGVLEMSQRYNAIAAINSDYFGARQMGIVIRNGVLYRSVPSEDVSGQLFVIYRDGTIKVYPPRTELDLEEIMHHGAWQGFCFGPTLLDEQGGVLPEYRKSNHEPRTIIGMVEPGHYMFIVVDGRQDGYSEGMSITGIGHLCNELGLTAAYNLDGGRTTYMTFLGQTANQPERGGRSTSDIVYVADIDVNGGQ